MCITNNTGPFTCTNELNTNTKFGINIELITCTNEKHIENRCIINEHYIGCSKFEDVYEVMINLIKFRNGTVINSENKGKKSYAVIECLCTNKFKLTWNSLRI